MSDAGRDGSEERSAVEEDANDDVYDSWEQEDGDEDSDAFLDWSDNEGKAWSGSPQIGVKVHGDVAAALTKEYVYEPVSHNEGRTSIRLIHLHPSTDFEDDIWCSLSTTYVGADEQVPKESYKALSYTWGSREDPEYLFVLPSTPGEDESHLRITQNLHEALRYMRHSTKETLWWIDAVCINQKDLPERDAQLPLMGQIYRQSTTVCAWLGPESSLGDGEFCLQLIEDVVVLDQPPLVPFSTTADPISGYGFEYKLRPRSSPRFNNGNLVDSNSIKLLETFFDREFFRRRWTIQERYFGGMKLTFRCGSTEALLNPFAHGGVLRFLTTKFEKPCKAETIKAMMGMLPWGEEFHIRNNNYISTPTSFMLRFVDTKCEDTRDKVIALQSIIHEEYRQQLGMVKVGYTSSIRDVYTAFARSIYYDGAFPVISRNGNEWPATNTWAITMEQTLKVFDDMDGVSMLELDAGVSCDHPYGCGGATGVNCRSMMVVPRRREDTFDVRLDFLCLDTSILSVAGSLCQGGADSGLPSWVPDWRQSLSYTPLTGANIPGRDRTFSTMAEAADSRLTKLQTIQSNFSQGRTPFIFRRKGVDGLGFEAKYVDTVVKVLSWPRGVTNCFEIISSLHAQYTEEFFHIKESSGTSMRTIMDTLVLGERFLDSLGNKQLAALSTAARSIPAGYDETMRKTTQGRVLFVTKAHYFGLGPENTTFGDQVWMADRGSPPLVLRDVHYPIFPPSSSPVGTEKMYGQDYKIWEELGVFPTPRCLKLVGDTYMHLHEVDLWNQWGQGTKEFQRICLI